MMADRRDRTRMSATLAARASSGESMRLLATAAGALALTVAAAAPARADLVLDGHGWGHGIGLSQYGAYGYALLDGRDHAWILGHYYTGTQLQRRGAGSIRVLLKRTRAPRLCGVTRLRDAAGRSVRLRETRTYRVTALAGGRLRVVDTANGRTRARVSAPATVSGGASWCLRGSADNGVRDGAYRGSAQLALDGRALLVVDRVGLEGYLRGVVPSEMPSAWPAEALEAQAVIARSYALRALRPASPYDVYADTRSQVYGGLSREVPATTAAVSATRGQVVTVAGAIAQTFFFSTSGGRTAANEEIWGGLPISYLRSVDDPHDDLSPYHDWTARFSDAVARRRLRDLGVGRFERMAVTARTPSDRAATVEVTGADGVVTVPAARIQMLLGLRSTWFDVAP
jgi:stage II sporulation protein D